MRYEILGPLRVLHGGGEFTLSARKTEVLLATLLIRANQIMSADQLVAELWPDEPPSRACAGLYVYISQLRKFLDRIHRARNPIHTRSPGYLFNLQADELDLHAFQAATLNGRRKLELGYAAQAATAFEEAVGLWRGSAFGGLPGGPIVSGFTIWLNEARLECLELLMKAYLLDRRHREAVNRLYSLVADYPLRETFYQMLMLALYRSDRQADALRVYQRARALIVDEIGLEPCRALRDLQQAILIEDQELNTLQIL